MRGACAIAVLPAALAASGCHLIFGYSTGGADTRPPDADVRPIAEGPSRERGGFVAVELQRSLDLLVVVDNSNSMQPKQVALRQAFDSLVDELARRPAGLPELHIGVVSTDLGAGTYNLPSCETIGGDAGLLQNAQRISGCTPPSDRWIGYAQGKSNVPDKTGADDLQRIKDAFKCIATLGSGGCGFEQPLEASRRALDPSKLPPANIGFLRPEADLLVVLYVTDEDDCSAANTALYDPSQQGLTDPLGPLTSYRCFEFGISCNVNGRLVLGPRQSCQPAYDWLVGVQVYVDFFTKALKPSKPGRVLLAAIAGPETPVEVVLEGANPALKASCMGKMTAVPAIRLKAVIDGVSPKGWLPGVSNNNICKDDYSDALARLSQQISDRLPPACVRAPQPDTVECEVREQHLPSGSPPRSVPRCDSGCTAGCKPCWQLVPHGCAREEAALEVVRQDPLPGGATVSARCR